MPRRTPRRTSKFRELVDTRNKADGLIHAVEKSLKDLGDKVDGEERATVRVARVSDLRTALKGEDKDAIDKKTEALAQASASIAQRAYAAAGGAGARPGPAAAGAARRAHGAKDDVVDAEFEEVKDKDRKAS